MASTARRTSGVCSAPNLEPRRANSAARRPKSPPERHRWRDVIVPPMPRHPIAALCAACFALPAFAKEVEKPVVPDWAIPGSATHKQVPPPVDFHRQSIHQKTPIGIFAAQSDIGAALVPGTATFANGTYTISSAGYNIWYSRDEFRFLWNKMSGDISLAADV